MNLKLISKTPLRLTLILCAVVTMMSWHAAPVLAQDTSVTQPRLLRLDAPDQKPLEYELVSVRGYLFLKVSLNDSTPVHFLFNPSVEQTVVDNAIAEIYLVNMLPGITQPYQLVDQQVPASRYQLRSLQIGTTRWRAPVIESIDLKELSRYMQFRVAGIVGRDLFNGLHLTLDFQSLKLIASKNPEPDAPDIKLLQVSPSDEGYLVLSLLENKDFKAIIDFSRMATLTFVGPDSPYSGDRGLLSAYLEYDARPMRLLDPMEPALNALLKSNSLHLSQPEKILPRYIQDKSAPARAYIGLRFFQGGRLHFDAKGSYLKIEPPRAVKKVPGELFADQLKRGPFHHATLRRRYVDYEALRNLGVSINQRDLDGRTALHLAVLYQDLYAVQLLLESKAQVNIADVQGKTALWYAATGDLRIIELLLEADADAKRADLQGVTPLMRAAGVDLPQMQVFINAGADVKRVDRAGRDALIHAMRQNASDVVNAMIPDTSPEETNRRVSPVLAAAEANRLDWIKALQVRGFALDATDPTSNFNALHFAAVRGNKDLIYFLIDRKVSTIQRGNVKNLTPVLIAVLNGNDEACMAILDTQKTVDIPPIDGVSSLLIASSQGMTQTVTRLITEGYRVNQPSRDGVYPLHYASGAGDLGMVKLLASAGAWIDATDGSGRTSLMYALNDGHLEIASALLELGASASLSDQKGNTPLHFLMHHGDHPAMVAALLEAGADPTQLSRLGWTPIMQAARNKRVHALKILLAHAIKNNQSVNMAELWPVAIEGFHDQMFTHIQIDQATLNTYYNSLETHQSPVNHAAAVGNAFALRQLIAMGYTLNSDNPNVITPLAEAIKNQRYQITQLLLRLHADAEHPSVKQAIKECKDKDVLQLVKPRDSDS